MKNSSPTLLIFLFVDDASFFLKTSQLNLIKLKQILDAYCATSRQYVNFQKLSLYFSSTSDPIKVICCNCFGINP